MGFKLTGALLKLLTSVSVCAHADEDVDSNIVELLRSAPGWLQDRKDVVLNLQAVEHGSSVRFRLAGETTGEPRVI